VNGAVCQKLGLGVRGRVRARPDDGFAVKGIQRGGEKPQKKTSGQTLMKASENRAGGGKKDQGGEPVEDKKYCSRRKTAKCGSQGIPGVVELPDRKTAREKGKLPREKKKIKSVITKVGGVFFSFLELLRGTKGTARLVPRTGFKKIPKISPRNPPFKERRPKQKLTNGGSHRDGREGWGVSKGGLNTAPGVGCLLE